LAGGDKGTGEEFMKLKKSKSALLMVDVQLDFCPGRSLAVKDGNEVVKPLNDFQAKVSLVVATRDWHPWATSHFKKDGGVWPVHCVKYTPGAEFHPDLHTGKAEIFSKGMGPEENAYSGFDGKNADGVSLEDFLKSNGITTVFIGGLATDYCVKATALDALKKGFKVIVLTDAIRAANISKNDDKKAIKEMSDAGVIFMNSDSI